MSTATWQRNEGKTRRTPGRAIDSWARMSQESGQVGTSSQKMESVESWTWRACSGESEASSWSSLLANSRGGGARSRAVPKLQMLEDLADDWVVR